MKKIAESKTSKKSINGKGIWRGILILSSVLTLTVIIFALFFIPTKATDDWQEVSLGVPLSKRTDIPEVVPIVSEEGFMIDEEEYHGTLLLKTDDAGDSYLDDTLFIGDSNTLRLYMFRLIKLQNVMGIEGMGIQSVTTHPEIYWMNQGSPDTIPTAVTKTQPRRIVICFGTNNLVNKNTKWFIENYSEVLTKLSEAYEYAEIIIMAVPPIGASCPDRSLSNKTVQEYNEGLLNLAKEKELRFLNTYEELVDRSNGAMKKNYIEGDGIHLTKAACEAVIKYFRTHASSEEDTRPKPLKPVGARKEAPPRPVEEKPKFSASAAASYVAGYLLNDGFTAKGKPIDFKKAIGSMGFSYADSTVKPGMEKDIAEEIYESVKSSYSKGIIALAGYYDEDAKTHFIMIYFFAPDKDDEEPPEDPNSEDPGGGGTDPGGGGTDPGGGGTDPGGGGTDPGGGGTDPGGGGGTDPGGGGEDPGGDGGDPGDPGGSDDGGDG